jgi:hypothetical protein
MIFLIILCKFFKKYGIIELCSFYETAQNKTRAPRVYWEPSPLSKFLQQNLY